jgi:hypothetical protein
MPSKSATLSSKLKSPAPGGGCAARSGVLQFAIISIGVIIFTLIFLSMYRAQRDGVHKMMETGGGGGGREGSIISMEHFFNTNTKTKTTKLYLFYMNGCGWCERFMPTWDDLYGKYSKVKGLEMRKIERGEHMAKDYEKHVDGYPTILLIKPDGAPIKFSGERTVSGVEAFLKSSGVDLALKESFDISNIKKKLKKTLSE